MYSTTYGRKIKNKKKKKVDIFCLSVSVCVCVQFAVTCAIKKEETATNHLSAIDNPPVCVTDENR